MDGHATEVAISAEDAFSRVHHVEPDVVVSDYRLPGISGAAFITQLRKNRTNVRAVVISAFTDDHTINEARAAGATFMAKPVDFKLLARIVGEGTS
jgi:DNA-binding NtrC family response regulator